ncbi:unnamed protein product [Brachionus calyciflorus]|uniref:Nudix hydrolase domain-containing protein n=1 Tax=Brachionus calyciflorus TaxID=104777 RepID=A0A813YT63_9BILA|nr:unnamed protein product [Brachionus calyciflorus]
MQHSAKRLNIHYKCRSRDPNNISYYQIGDNETAVARPVVSDENYLWDKTHQYKPIDYTSPIVLQQPTWADPIIPKADTKWNDIDHDIDRRSHMGHYEIINGLPRNPVGRTGLVGRGLLGKWGPNHAADPIVTRWKMNTDGTISQDKNTLKPILQFVAIQRKDTGEWAIPGGMCDPGEKVSITLKREFMEEALNSLSMSDEQRKQFQDKLSNLFNNGLEIYRGYVDDPRNTDNAWMETIAFNFHDDSGLFKSIELNAGDDAGHVEWIDISSNLKLYASHRDFIKKVANSRKAYW